MVTWPFWRLSDLQLGDKKVTLNHLVKGSSSQSITDPCFRDVFEQRSSAPASSQASWMAAARKKWELKSWAGLLGPVVFGRPYLTPERGLWFVGWKFQKRSDLDDLEGFPQFTLTKGNMFHKLGQQKWLKWRFELEMILWVNGIGVHLQFWGGGWFAN